MFRRGLADAASKTQAWVMTNGTLGVAAVAGRAVAERDADGLPITCIGVLPWAPGPGDKISGMRQRNGRVATYEQGESTAADARLEPNHTHFLLVDDRVPEPPRSGTPHGSNG